MVVLERPDWRFRHRTPQAGEAEPVVSRLGELPFRLRRLRAGELEEVRRRYEAPCLRKSPTLRAEVDDRRAFCSSGREAPSQLCEPEAVLHLPDHRSGVGRPYVVTGLQVRCSPGKADGDPGLAERLEIGRIRYVVAIIVAHGG